MGMPSMLTETARTSRPRLSKSKNKKAIDASRVLNVLEEHILLDGFKIVIDLEKSNGSYLVDAATGHRLIDLYGFFGSMPVGFNHPHFDQAEVKRDLLSAAKAKVANSDVYSEAYAKFVDTFARVAGLPPLDRYLFVEGGALAVENTLKAAMDWKVRKNMAAGIGGERGTEILHFRRAFHGRSGYTMSLTNTDPRKTDLFAKFEWPRVSCPHIDFPVTAEVETDVAAAEQRALEQVKKAFADNPDDIAAIIIEPIQAEGGDNHFRPEFLQALQRMARENECLFIVDEVQCGVALTGKMWAHEHFGITPDLLAFGKKMQVCGCMGGPRLDEEPQNVFKVSSRINSTWGGGLTDMIRAGRYLEIIDEDRL